MANILWMDNDRTYLLPFISRLEGAGHTVIRAYTVAEAEWCLARPEEKLPEHTSWNLILIDLMMPIRQEKALGDRYSAEITKKGRCTGVVFYKYNEQRIDELGAIAAFLTMREDEELDEEVEALGLPPENFRHKMAVADTKDFLAWINTLLD